MDKKNRKDRSMVRVTPAVKDKLDALGVHYVTAEKRVWTYSEIIEKAVAECLERRVKRA